MRICRKVNKQKKEKKLKIEKSKLNCNFYTDKVPEHFDLKE